VGPILGGWATTELSWRLVFLREGSEPRPGAAATGHSAGSPTATDVLVSTRRNAEAARAFFARATTFGPAPVEVTTDRAPVYPRVIDERVPSARHVVEQYANNVVETDHGRLKARLRPMRGLKRLTSTRTIAAGHAFVQNLRRGHYEYAVDLPARDRVRVAFDDLASRL
jgi:hypothetical protein